MNKSFSPLFQSFEFPVSGIQISNRILMSPMTTWSGNNDGTVSEAEIAYYKRRAHGVGAVVTACAFVLPQGRGFAGQIGVHSDAMLPSLSRIAVAVKEGGSKAILQLYHGGRMCPPALLPDGQALSASNIPVAFGDAVPPCPMTESEILETIAAYGNAARRAAKAGFDGVEIHGANGYLVQQFFSPHANRRSDQWGGSMEGRLRFPLAVVEAVVSAAAKTGRPFIVGYRLSPEEIENPGITMDDTLQLSDALAECKLDYIHISTLNFWAGSLRDTEDKRLRALMIYEHIGKRKPVIGVGSVRTPDDALRLLESGVPLIAMGRELLMEPDWVEKIQSGRESSIRTTLSLNAREELAIPEGLWKMMLGRKGWLPVEE
jgi:2,4-dienoyl-CoA reductase-like NADH-dependent reductase (Old Yellow Enzyme family)